MAGVYGLITIFVGGSFVQLLFYAYSVVTLFAFLWALRIVKSVSLSTCPSCSQLRADGPSRRMPIRHSLYRTYTLSTTLSLRCSTTYSLFGIGMNCHTMDVGRQTRKPNWISSTSLLREVRSPHRRTRPIRTMLRAWLSPRESGRKKKCMPVGH